MSCIVITEYITLYYYKIGLESMTENTYFFILLYYESSTSVSPTCDNKNSPLTLKARWGRLNRIFASCRIPCIVYTYIVNFRLNFWVRQLDNTFTFIYTLPRFTVSKYFIRKADFCKRNFSWVPIQMCFH